MTRYKGDELMYIGLACGVFLVALLILNVMTMTWIGKNELMIDVSVKLGITFFVIFILSLGTYGLFFVKWE